MKCLFFFHLECSFFCFFASMSGSTILWVLIGYFSLLLVISLITSRKATNATFFQGNRQSHWFLVAFGMVGASLSGVTFISVPGWVGTTHWHYYQMVLGYIVGYILIAQVLLPIYYKLELTSIYTYLRDRLGHYAYKTGAFYFLLSRTLGAAFRLFLVAGVLQLFVFDELQVPFWLTVTITLGLIWVYTFRGGIRTIVFTDTLQTALMLLATFLTIALIGQELDMGIGGMASLVANSGFSEVFNWNWQDSTFFPKHFIGGALVAATMTGLDQDMMQKNLSCRSLGEAQKNIRWQAFLFPAVNIFFLSMGVLLTLFIMVQYQQQTGITMDMTTGMQPVEAIHAMGQQTNTDITYLNEQGQMAVRTDYIFPMVALRQLPAIVGIIFLIGLIAAAYSSADSALTALTTSFCIDFLGYDPKSLPQSVRIGVHVGISIVLLGLILLMEAWGNQAVIGRIFTAATYTYGPLLGLFTFGIFTKRIVFDKWVPLVCIVAPVLCYLLKTYEANLMGGYQFGYEMLGINGILTFIGLWLLSKPQSSPNG